MRREHDEGVGSESKSRPIPPRSFGRATLALASLLSAAIVGSGAYWFGRATRDEGRFVSTDVDVAAVQYHCPMHPSVVQDRPGNCPICGMALVRGASGGRGPDAHLSTATGRAMVEIDPARQQWIGLATSPVTTGPVGGAWRTVGRIVADETRVRHVNVKVAGFVEHVYVDFVGKAVGVGDPLFTVYSPELLSAQDELLLALRTRAALLEGEALASDGEALVRAARRKLSLWDIPDAEIDRIAATGETVKTLTFFSPVSGVVTRKDVVEGMRLEAGAMPYEIVDLSNVWVLADIYESELRRVREGMAATLTLNAYPDREFAGSVLFVDPAFDPRTRTVKVRLSFANPTGDLRPEMFGEVVLRGTPRTATRIPVDAVIDSGTEKIVFVALGGGKFEPRVVGLGETGGTSVEVVSGLEVGDSVVTRANFLIDSESKLRAALAALAGDAASGPERARVLPERGSEREGSRSTGRGEERR